MTGIEITGMPKGRARAYIIVRDDYIDHFEEKIDALLGKDWELYGSPFIFQNKYNQAMIKREKPYIPGLVEME